jgi:hypothetical protein
VSRMINCGRAIRLARLASGLCSNDFRSWPIATYCAAAHWVKLTPVPSSAGLSSPGEGKIHRKACLVERKLKSYMPLEHHRLLHPLTGLGRVSKESSRRGGLLADQIPYCKCSLRSFAGLTEFGSQFRMNGHVVEFAEAALQVF